MQLKVCTRNEGSIETKNDGREGVRIALVAFKESKSRQEGFNSESIFLLFCSGWSLCL